jgi:hypothetical protein
MRYFARFFARVVQQCQLAGLVSAETIHIDASLIRANVSMDARVARHIDAVIPPLRSARRKGAKGFPTDRFKFDPRDDVVKCPASRRLTPRNSTKTGKWYRGLPTRLRALSPPGAMPAPRLAVPPDAYRHDPCGYLAC